MLVYQRVDPSYGERMELKYQGTVQHMYSTCGEFQQWFLNWVTSAHFFTTLIISSTSTSVFFGKEILDRYQPPPIIHR